MSKQPSPQRPPQTSSKLPINLEDLLRQRTVEQDRIEYKAGWNPDAIIRTLCAFANDFENLGGGYVIIGQDCDEHGQPIFPPVGVADNQLDKIQRELLKYANLIQPPYFPVLSIESFADKNLVVLWAPGGQTRPYSAPKEVTAKHRTSHYYIRRYSSTIEAKGDDQRELISLAATVPFDDRMCRAATVDDLSLPLIREFLKEIGSGLYQARAKTPLVELARLLNIVDGPDERLTPRNVGVLFYSDAPDKFLPGTQIDVVIFPQGAGGDQIVEKILRGPIHQQIRDALRYIQNNVIVEKVVKHPDRAKATRFFNYPMAAIEEALVNAMYHRGYDQREPVEVRVNPESIQILSYPGPDPSIRTSDLRKRNFVARRYRNRRIGEFFKELEMTEGRCTGVPKIYRAMARNGSPKPKFTTDELRLWFVAELPIHREFAGEVTAQVTDYVTDHVTDHVVRLLRLLTAGAQTAPEIMQNLKMTHRPTLRANYLHPALEAALIEMTSPDTPRSRSQKYRLTPAGRAVLDARDNEP